MTFWKITKNVSNEGKLPVITGIQELTLGKHRIKHGGSTVPVEILPGEVIRLRPGKIKDGGLYVGLEHADWRNPIIVSLDVKPKEGERIVSIWASINNGVNEVVDVEKHSRPPRIGKEAEG